MRARAWAETVETYYIDENGTRHDVTATVVTTYMDYLGTDGETSWYVVNQNVFLYDGSNNQTCLHGNVNLIIADGCELKPACGSNGPEDGFRGSGNLTLYVQTAGTGTLSCGEEGFLNITGDFTVCSGMVSVSGNRYNAIRAANFTMRGGSVTVQGDFNLYEGQTRYGIDANGINLSWTSTDD